MTTGTKCVPRGRWAAIGALLGLLLSSLTGARGADAADKTPLEMLPASTVIYLDVPSPGAVVASIMDHPLAARLEQEDAVQQALATPQYGAFRVGLGLVELTIGMTWRKAIETLTDGGVTIGLDPDTNGVALFAISKDEATLNRVRDLFLKISRDEAQKKGNPDPVQTRDYRGVTAYRVDQVRFAILGRMLVLTNKDELGKKLLDAWFDGGASLANEPSFKKALAERGAVPGAWAFVRLDKIRDAGMAQGLFRGKADNIAAEVLVGGILNTLQKTPYVTARADIDREGLKFAVMAPQDRNWIPAARHYYFGGDGKGAAPGALNPTGTLLNLATYRDLGGVWNSAPELLDQKANAELAQANSNLSNLFGGQDFGQDVLTTFGPEWQLVVARQTYPDAATAPQMKLPAGALVFRLRDPEKAKRSWKVTFQSLIGFLNIVGAMQRRPPFELDSQQADGVQYVTATYGPPDSNGQLRAGAVYYNFSPTMAVIEDRLILSSSQGLARELVKLKPVARDPAAASVVNTRVQVDLATVREALVDNRGQLIAQNMLDKGHPRADAEREIDTLLALAKLLRHATLQLDSTAEQLRLGVEIGVNGEAP